MAASWPIIWEWHSSLKNRGWLGSDSCQLLIENVTRLFSASPWWSMSGRCALCLWINCSVLPKDISHRTSWVCDWTEFLLGKNISLTMMPKILNWVRLSSSFWLLWRTWNASWYHHNSQWSLEDRGFQNALVNTGNQDISKHYFSLPCLTIAAWLSILSSQVHHRELVGLMPSWAY